LFLCKIIQGQVSRAKTWQDENLILFWHISLSYSIYILSGFQLICCSNISSNISFKDKDIDSVELTLIPVGKIAKRTVWRSALLLIRHSNCSAILSKIHSYKLLFWRFCPLGWYRDIFVHTTVHWVQVNQQKNWSTTPGYIHIYQFSAMKYIYNSYYLLDFKKKIDRSVYVASTRQFLNT